MTKRSIGNRFTLPGAVICAAVIIAATYSAIEANKPVAATIPIEGALQVCFTPNRGCQQQIIAALGQAQSHIAIQAYSFTDPDIVSALVAAKKRNVRVEAILDHSNRKDLKKLVAKLVAATIPVKIDHPKGIAHNKIIIIDEDTVITGSYNFSIAAYTRNTENLLVIRDKKIAAAYMVNFQQRWTVSQHF